MNRALKWLVVLAVLCCVQVHAQITNTISFAWENSMSQPYQYRTMQLFPATYNTNGTFGVSLDYISYYTSATGAITASNVVPGYYKVLFNGPSTNTISYILVPTNNPATLQYSSLLVVATNITLPANQYAYPASVSDGRYVQFPPTNIPNGFVPTATNHGSYFWGTNASSGGGSGIQTNGGTGFNNAFTNVTLIPTNLVPPGATYNLGPTGNNGIYAIIVPVVVGATYASWLPTNALAGNDQGPWWPTNTEANTGNGPAGWETFVPTSSPIYVEGNVQNSLVREQIYLVDSSTNRASLSANGFIGPVFASTNSYIPASTLSGTINGNQINNSTISNATLISNIVISAKGKPTNTYTSSAGFSGTLGSNVLTCSPGGFTGWYPGYSVTLATNGNAQYEICKFFGAGVAVDGGGGTSTNAYIINQPIQATVSNVHSGFVSPNTITLFDDTGNNAYNFIDGAGEYGTVINQNGFMYFLHSNGTNGFTWNINIGSIGEQRLILNSQWTHNPVMSWSCLAPADSTGVLSDGTFEAKFSLTNRSGPLVLHGNGGVVTDPISGTTENFSTSSTLNAVTANSVVSSNTVSSQHFIGIGTAPTAVTNLPGSGAGSTIALDSGAHDSAMLVTLTSGSGPSAGPIPVATITFATAFTGTIPHSIVQCSGPSLGSGVSGKNFYCSNSLTTCTIWTPSTLAATTAYPLTVITVQ